jgi:hypothetical protein
MLKKLRIGISAALIFAGGSAAAMDRGVPTIDIQKGCRAAEAELTALFGNQSDAYKACMDDEQAGHDQLVKDWANFSTLAKGLCVQPMEYLPSYVEWQVCLEMTRDVGKMREEASEATGRGGQPTTGRQCPAVKIGDDGNIISLETRCGR